MGVGWHTVKEPPVRARLRVPRAIGKGGEPAGPSCGSVTELGEDLSAPLFLAAERPRRLIAERAPFGLRMKGKPEEQMLRALRRYQRNTSLPIKCAYRTCAVVGSSGSLRGALFGEAIDAHDAVIRINAAPVYSYEAAVGTRTSWRVHNSEKPFMLAAIDDLSLQVTNLSAARLLLSWPTSRQLLLQLFHPRRNSHNASG